jgi:ataxia telangiectasia mutated family protein
LPRIVWCEGDDGRVYKQLVKGRDDLRGDSIMQQVFGLVNTLLGHDAATRQRDLSMRTYEIRS